MRSPNPYLKRTVRYLPVAVEMTVCPSYNADFFYAEHISGSGFIFLNLIP